MSDTERERLEAALQRADELEQANAVLAARNAALVAGPPALVAAPPAPVAKRHRGVPYALAATSIIAGTVLALIPGCELLAALGFVMPLFAVFAVGMLRVMQWLERKDLL
jgi:hypothetical protein